MKIPKINNHNRSYWLLLISRYLPVVLWGILIFTLSSIEQIVVSQFFIWDFIAKKIAHITEYAIFYLLLFRATGKNWYLAYILTIIYAVSDEYHQSFVPGRTAAPYDLGFDASGAHISGYLLWKLKLLHLPKRKQSQKKSPPA